MVSNDKLRLKTGHRKYLIGLPCLGFRKTTEQRENQHGSPSFEVLCRQHVDP